MTSRRFAPKAAAAALSALLCIALLPVSAFGEVRKGDLVGGETVELRGMPASSAPAIAANYSILVDSDGNVYFERSADERTQVASITKMMTALVAIDSVPLDFAITVSENAASVGESTAQLEAGDKLTLEQALVGLMVPSGNDAAVAIAECVGQQILDDAKAAGETVLDADGQPIDASSANAAYDAFIAKMNERAQELGCENTRFSNPHGLDFDQWEGEEMYSTARDIASIASVAMREPAFQDVVSGTKDVMVVERDGVATDIQLHSTDELLGAYEDACGIKTGYTDKAGQCFAGAFTHEGKYLFAIVLDSTTNEQRFDDAQSLYEWELMSETDYALANSDQTTTLELAGVTSDVPVIGYLALPTWRGKTVPVTMANPEATIKVSSIFGNVSQEVDFDNKAGGVDVGEVVGKINFYQNNELIASQDLIACESVPDPNVFDIIANGFGGFVDFVTGNDSTVESSVLNKTPLLLSKN